MIKKDYLKPETVEIVLKLEGMICTSGTGETGGFIDGEDDTPGGRG